VHTFTVWIVGNPSITELGKSCRSSAFGSAVALFAICQYLSSTPKFYWLFSPGTGSGIFGPYVNRDHYAGLMELFTPFARVLSLSRLVHGGQRMLSAVAAIIMAGRREALCLHCLAVPRSRSRKRKPLRRSPKGKARNDELGIWEDVNGPPFAKRVNLTSQQYNFPNLGDLVSNYGKAREEKEESAARLKSIGIPVAE